MVAFGGPRTPWNSVKDSRVSAEYARLQLDPADALKARGFEARGATLELGIPGSNALSASGGLRTFQEAVRVAGLWLNPVGKRSKRALGRKPPLSP